LNLSSFFQGIPGNDGVTGQPGLPGKTVSKQTARGSLFHFNSDTSERGKEMEKMMLIVNKYQ
jgi:hypothetical protein